MAKKDAKKKLDPKSIDDKPVSDFVTKPSDASALQDDGGKPEISNPDAVSDDKQTADKAKQRMSAFSGGKGRLNGIFSKLNPYLVLFIAVFVIGIILLISLSTSNDAADKNKLTFEGSDLTQDSLNDLLASETNVGTVDQTLTVAANAIFNGTVLVKDDLDVAGSISVGGPLSLPGITVAGDSSFESVSIDNSLQILGSATVQQNLTVQGAFSASGGASIEGLLSAEAIEAESLSFSGTLALTGHIVTSGSQPGATRGSAVGGGGTISITGTDTAGTITINTGSSPPAGVFINISFAAAYGAKPHVQITPINSNSGSLSYYATRDKNGFAIGTASAPNASTTYVYDYLVIE